MKKFIVLALVLSICAVGVFAAGPTVNGDVSAIYKYQGDPMDTAANMGRLRLAIGVPVGDFVTFNMDLRNDQGFPAGAVGGEGLDYLAWNQVYVVTNVSGALGLEGVKINLTGGNFEYWIANWNAATTTHRGRMVETFAIGSGATAVALDADFGPAQVLSYVNLAGAEAAYKVGVRLGPVVEGLNAVVSYSAKAEDDDTVAADEIQYFKAEAGYKLAVGDGMSLFIPVSFLSNMVSEVSMWGSGVKFMGMGVTAAVEVGSANIEEDMLKFVDVNLAYDAMKYLQVYAKAFTDTSDGAADFLTAVDLGVRWTVGANKLYAGYVVDVGDPTTIAVTDDDSSARAGVAGGGLYLGWRLTY